MKAVIFSGSHKRHLHYNSELVKHFNEALVILMQREEELPKTPAELNLVDKQNFEYHFSTRKKIEDETYGNINYKDVFGECELLRLKADELNTNSLANKIKKFDADICFIFGTDMIKGAVFKALPNNKINLHLGLSPWYRGSATLFWPFYFLKPQYAGITFHQIIESPDAGEIIHQSLPQLEYGDGIHDVGIKCVNMAKDDARDIIDVFRQNKKFDGIKQNYNGKLWKVSDFHSSHLRVIYNLFDNKIVDLYLDGKLGKQVPRLFSCIKNK
tara:strand:- start:3031 stop:3843 length:813 start_codon:yes stop_codon:yes gene_type:complete